MIQSEKRQIFTHIQLMSHFMNDSILSIQMNWCKLSLLSNSVDVIVLVHLLEVIDYPIKLLQVKLLQEIFYTLKPSGKLIILSCNPWSLWELKKLFPEISHGKGSFSHLSNDG